VLSIVLTALDSGAILVMHAYLLKPEAQSLVDALKVLAVSTVLLAGWTALYVLLTGPRRHREVEIQLQLALREAELRALEAQINPHFLFNCLNSIRGLVVENPARSQDMLTRLANILRYNLRRDIEHTVPLRSEVEIVTDYLALESARFEDRLRIHISIDPDAAPVQVPPMLLQTLVENALKHGIAPLPAGGDLLVRAIVVGDSMVLEVENPGQIAESGPGSQPVGLANIRERLRILYNGRASFELKNRDGRVAATVLIPTTA
jgi:LytS/YehU family sensor histidine kinase